MVRLNSVDTSSPDKIAAQLARTDLTPPERAELRRVALQSGWWGELEARFPARFGQAFELVGTGAPSTATFTRAPREPPVPDAVLAKLAGKDAFIRVRRADGRVDAVAAKLGDVYPGEEILLKEFKIDEAAELMHDGDAPFFRPALARGSTVSMPLSPHDSVITAVELGFDVMRSAQSPLKRTSIRERAGAVARGEYSPRIDLTRPQDYLVDRPPQGSFMGATQNLLRADFVSAVKVEQNVLATPLVHEIVRRAVARIGAPDCAKQVGEAKSWHGIGQSLFENVGKPVIEELVAEWTSKKGASTPLGQAFANLRRVVDFSYAFIPSRLPGDMVGTAEGLLRAGLTTGISVLVDMGRAAQAHTQGHPELSATTVLRDSTPTIVRLASPHMEVFLAMHAVFKMGANPELSKSFELVEHAGKHRLKPTAAALKTLATHHGLRPDTILPGTTGCLAAVALEDGNPIQKLTEAFASLLESLNALPQG